jgi:hypothetical protein
LISRLLARLRKQPEQSQPVTAPATNDFSDGWSWVPNWREILGDWSKWEAAVEAAKGGPRVLVAPCVGGNSALTPVETLYAVALTLRGAEVHVLLCDKAIPACMNVIAKHYDDKPETFLQKGPDKCDWCHSSGSKAFEQLGLKIHRLSEWIEDSDRTDAKKIAQTITFDNAAQLIDQDINVGEQAVATALRFFARGDFQAEPTGLDVLKRYVEAGVACNRGLQRLYKALNIKHSVVNHGIYVPQGLVVGVSKKFGSSICTWDLGYRSKSVYMHRGDTYLRSSDANSVWENLDWTPQMEAEIQNYLQTRWHGTLDWLNFQHKDAESNFDAIAKEIGIDPSKPFIGLLTNVVWDAQVLYPQNAFPNMLHWLKGTIEYFAKRPDLQLVIRIHPGELKGFVVSRQLAADEIRKMFPQLPPNVFVVPPESKINTYAALTPCNAVLIYATTTGLEFASQGYQVVVAGEAWIRGRGFSKDAQSEDEYYRILDKLPFEPARLSPELRQRALKYAYHHYLRKMVPLSMLNHESSPYTPYTIDKRGIAGFMPGADIGLDTLCDGILTDKPLIYPQEKVDAAKALNPSAGGWVMPGVAN